MEPDKAAVRTFKGPKICGDGLDIQGDILLTASFATENALQVGFDEGMLQIYPPESNVDKMHDLLLFLIFSENLSAIFWHAQLRV